AALEQAVREVDAVKQAAAMQGASAEPEAPSATGASIFNGTVGAGERPAAPSSASAPGEGPRGEAFQLSGVWKGKALRQLFQTDRGEASGDEIKRLVVEYNR